MGVAGAGSLAQVLNTALGNQARFTRFREFFAGVGTGDTAGVWQDTPRARPEFRAQYKKQLAKMAGVRSTAEDGI
jgi:chlorophyllide a reductase subunit Y